MARLRAENEALKVQLAEQSKVESRTLNERDFLRGQVEAAEAKVAALTKERDDHRNAALEMREEVRKLYNHNQAIVPALQERVKELEAAWPNEIQAREALKESEAKLAQMREVVEAAKELREYVRRKAHGLDPINPIAGRFDATLSRLTDAPEKPIKKCPCGCDKTVSDGSCHHFGGYNDCPVCCPPSPGKDDGGKS